MYARLDGACPGTNFAGETRGETAAATAKASDVGSSHPSSGRWLPGRRHTRPDGPQYAAPPSEEQTDA